MQFLISQKAFVYLYDQFVHTDLTIVETEDDSLDFLELAKKLDFEVLCYGKELMHDPVLVTKQNLQEFAQFFFDLRERKRVSKDAKDKLNEYCELLEEHLA